MKRFDATLIILMLGILPAAAESVSTQPVRAAALDAMVREILEWINEHTEFSVSAPPEIVFHDQIRTAEIEDELKRRGGLTQWDRDFVPSGLGGIYSKTAGEPDSPCRLCSRCLGTSASRAATRPSLWADPSQR